MWHVLHSRLALPYRMLHKILVRSFSSEAGGCSSAAINLYSAMLLGGLSALVVMTTYDHFVHLGKDISVLKQGKHYTAMAEVHGKLIHIGAELGSQKALLADMNAKLAGIESMLQKSR